MAANFEMEARLAYLRWLAAEDQAAQKWIRTLREYFDGQHPTFLTERMEEFLALKAKDSKHQFSHNLCRLVVEAVVERLAVTGFAPKAAQGENTVSPLATASAEWWEANRMDAGEDDLYEAALRDAVSFLIVDWDAAEMRPRWSINYAFDGTQGVKVHRDADTDRILFASKRWQVQDDAMLARSGRTRLTLYWPDRVEKWISAQGQASGRWSDLGWEPYETPDEPWPIPWLDASGVALGMPVIAFENPGGSEIGDVIPLQDMLNKSDLDLIAASDAAGFRILWASGLKAQIDPATGKEMAITIGPSNLVRMGDPQARMGAIEPADLEKLINGSKYWVESIAGVSRTPQYLFQAHGGDQPSGESLKNQREGLTDKVARRQKVFGNAWEDAIYLSARLWNLYRTADAVEIERLSTLWAPADRRDGKEVLEEAQIKSGLGVPDEQIWAELGYDQAQIQRFLQLRVEAQQRQETVGSFLLRNFDRGQ